jgi:hypothetical protein
MATVYTNASDALSCLRIEAMTVACRQQVRLSCRASRASLFPFLDFLTSVINKIACMFEARFET